MLILSKVNKFSTAVGYKNQQNESRIVLQAKYLDTLKKKKKKPKKLYTTKYLT